MCTHSGCTKSFDTNQKIKGHVKTPDGSCTFTSVRMMIHHSDKRHMCAHPNCLPVFNTDTTYYPTRTSLRLMYIRPTLQYACIPHATDKPSLFSTICEFIRIYTNNKS
ncbi:hypothetical protein DFJ58DRAFT_754809 [Suillus subalutaceus]|uniref:uncharacterized protein n=1 Tax=Suillus subalutaceus TaxID=48586 RepID=UPI001B886DF4|nr:uncharacterized protein DFJ58DRAFT_754809 [Suillus subalutaceus]KAG1876535.1 hypothetical protein DFJ58DRAFT_754809 [Suillus subalutaceus]